MLPQKPHRHIHKLLFHGTHRHLFKITIHKFPEKDIVKIFQINLQLSQFLPHYRFFFVLRCFNLSTISGISLVCQNQTWKTLGKYFFSGLYIMIYFHDIAELSVKIAPSKNTPTHIHNNLPVYCFFMRDIDIQNHYTQIPSKSHCEYYSNLFPV